MDQSSSTDVKSSGCTSSLHDLEYDHPVSLELGSDPDDPRTLRVEPPSSAAGPNNDKDKLETHLHTAICSGCVTVAAEQKAIGT